MSRAATSKNTKDKRSVQPVSTPVVTHEIITGKLTDHDWAFMLEKDETEEFINRLCDEVLDTALIRIYQLYLDHQLLPYTIALAKDALIQIIEWRFLSCDNGELDTENDINWSPDEEPEALVTDCWAQGAIPKIGRLKTQETLPVIPEYIEPDVVQVCEIEGTAVLESSNAIELIEEMPEVESLVSVGYEDRQPRKETGSTPLICVKKEERALKKRHLGPLKSAGVSRMQETLEEREKMLMDKELTEQMNLARKGIPQFLDVPDTCHSLVKVKKSTYDRRTKMDMYGNLLSICKLNTAKLPTHRVDIKYHIRHPSEDARVKLSKLLMSGRYQARYGKTPDPVQHIDRSSCTSRRTRMSTPTQMKGQGCLHSITNLPSSLIENIDLAPGVTVQEGDKIRHGPPRKHRTKPKLSNSATDLKCLMPRNNQHTFNADDIFNFAAAKIITADKPVIPSIQPTAPYLADF